MLELGGLSGWSGFDGVGGEVGRSIGVGGRCWSWAVCLAGRALMGLGVK